MISEPNVPYKNQKQSRIVILVWNIIQNDPRVRRQGDIFQSAGWSVAGVGIPGKANADSPSWPIYTEPQRDYAFDLQNRKSNNNEVDDLNSQSTIEAKPENQEFHSSAKLSSQFITKLSAIPSSEVIIKVARRLINIIHQAKYIIRQSVNIIRQSVNIIRRALLKRVEMFFYVIHLMRMRIQSGYTHDYAEKQYWSWPAIQQIYATAKDLRADIWLANDWNMLPVAARLARENGGRYSYDSHEYAIYEYSESFKWRLERQPLISAIEQTYIENAICVSTVSQGITDALDSRYRQCGKPFTIRNIPIYHQAAFRPTDVKIHVLYHGIIAPQRKLEECIKSVRMWRDEFTLTIRGIGNKEYLESLNSLIRELKLDDRVKLAPPVPMTALVQEATAFDIGLFALEAINPHYYFALPNKIFEYIMAGLALCVSDLPEMKTLVQEYSLGATIDSKPTPEKIAFTINSFNHSSIDQYKKNALKAANQLNWDHEGRRMVQKYEDALAGK